MVPIRWWFAAAMTTQNPPITFRAYGADGSVAEAHPTHPKTIRSSADPVVSCRPSRVAERVCGSPLAETQLVDFLMARDTQPDRDWIVVWRSVTGHRSPRLESQSIKYDVS